MSLLAYLDPGTGSMLLQALLGGAAGVAVAVKLFGRRVFGFLTFWKRRPDRPVAATKSEPEPHVDGR
jgi:hypothetical protein